MKQAFFIILALCVSLSLKAQVIEDGSRWFDGNAYYEADLQDRCIIFKGKSADDTYEFEFKLVYIGTEGFYKLGKANENSIIPFRSAYGCLVRGRTRGDANVLEVLNNDGLASWTLTKTNHSHKKCLATELWAKSQPIEKMISSYIMNVHYLSVLSKSQLRYMLELLKSKQQTSFVEDINMEMIQSELGVPDFQRINAGDLQALSEASAQQEVWVKNEVEFINALKSNTTINLPEGTYINLTKALSDWDLFTSNGRMHGEHIDEISHILEPALINESVYDGRQLTLINLNNITIKGEGDCHIVVEPAYAYVLHFINCNNIRLENLTMGHTALGFCTGGVVGMMNCSDMTIEGCDLYGCGAYGLIANRTQNILMQNSIIRDCSYGIMELSDCSGATFSKCNFYRNKEYSMVTVCDGCKDILFEECRFYENKGLLFDLECKIQLKSCGIVHNDLEAIGDFSKYIEQLDEYTTIKIANY